ncbi:hypothetical protein [Vibrio furnissii]|uniref:hypothetical protein n=1 Tax=Vibrio furnissii TaxID=29494 RepID=UPI001EEC2A8C|nr:hypothetical protein [Vibrio furnissii]
MNYVRIALFSSMCLLSLYFVQDDVSSAFSNAPVIIISGILNVWAAFGGAFIGAYLVLLFMKEQFRLSIRLWDFNRVIAVVGLLIAPVLAIATYNKAHSNTQHYVECKSERKISSRYSSRTYAVTESLCGSSNDKRKH